MFRATLILALCLSACVGRRECESCAVWPIDAALPDARVGCDPFDQSSCNTGEKCTWLVDAYLPSLMGHIGCAPDGSLFVGDPCMYGAAGPTGYDACKRGLVCNDYAQGRCRQICDPRIASSCVSPLMCTTDPNRFVRAGEVVAGTCE